MKKHIVLVLSCVLAVLGFLRAQTSVPAQYEPLVCRGAIPTEVITTSAAKYKRAAAEISKNKSKKKSGRKQKQFTLESTFVIDNLLQSGRVLFNDEVSAYLNEVAVQVLNVQPLSKKRNLKIYALRSHAVNAFATDRGEIFVTLGLLAQLENEAQLAYIIAHEMSHIERSHALSFYLESDKIERRQNRSVLGRSLTDDKLLAKCAFSKEHEGEADRLGLDRILQTRYSTASLSEVFDVLKYGYLPFDDRPFDRNLLQSEHYQFPESYWLKEVKAIEGMDEAADDAYSSHPNLKSRREALLKTLEGKKEEGRSDFLVSADRFERVRHVCRMELPMMFLQDDRLPEAVYTTALLLEKEPQNVYLKKCLLKALYLNAKFHRDSDYHFNGDYNKVEGESQQVFHLLDKMPADEAAIMALRYALALQDSFPADSEIKRISGDLFFELSEHFEQLDRFSDAVPVLKNEEFEAPPELPEEVTTKVAKPKEGKPKEKSKYDRIRQKKQEEQKEAAVEKAGSGYWKYAFAGKMSTELFKQQWEEARKKKEKEAETGKRTAEAAKKAYKRQQRKGWKLGISKIAVVNPFYLKVDERKSNSIQYLATEKGQGHFCDLIREAGQEADLKMTFLDVSSLKENQTETFNDIRFLNEWFAQQVHHYDLSLTPGYDQQRIDAIAKKYGTDYFLWTGVVSLREKNRSGWYLIPGSMVLFFPTLPLAIYASAKPKYDMLQYAILFDVRTGKRQVLKMDVFKHKDTDSLLKAHLYDTFSQIKRPGKR